MTGNMYFAERIRQMRKDRQESQSFVASLVGYQKQAVSHWENNGKVPRTKVLKILAEHYEVSTDYLLGVTNKKAQEDMKMEKTDCARTISLDEKKLLIHYRMMDEEQKDTVQKVAEKFVSFKMNEKTQAPGK